MLVICRDVSDRVLMAETKLAAIRSQMNSHFIFNSLNSIQHYIHSNKKQEAESFLVIFATLIRSILNNSAKSVIPLSDEIYSIELYLKLEKARFGQRLNYNISVADNVDTENTLVPCSLIQPYIENAINYGIHPLQKDGSVSLEISREENFIICIIKDNGIGREKSYILNREAIIKKPNSLRTTQTRLELLNQQLSTPVAVKITDMYDDQNSASGTHVKICIPFEECF